ncbi:hypothetical protein SAMN05444359_102194 [Neolewinella agarilytica]|uniref:Uncharacterized protein n=1 Tax=Neolewinella agarilytica TaxID=478744 RepID=A0A1H9AQM9_9BACT|nr:hypothetical protein SAMN05444359_102194 [Neolewinella agarilytica]
MGVNRQGNRNLSAETLKGPAIQRDALRSALPELAITLFESPTEVGGTNYSPQR